MYFAFSSTTHWIFEIYRYAGNKGSAGNSTKDEVCDATEVS
jgi:hypothetical protein